MAQGRDWEELEIQYEIGYQVGRVRNFHIRKRIHKDSEALCGADIMFSKIPLRFWGATPADYYPLEHWCEACASEADIEHLAEIVTDSAGRHQAEPMATNRAEIEAHSAIRRAKVVCELWPDMSVGERAAMSILADVLDRRGVKRAFEGVHCKARTGHEEGRSACGKNATV